MENFKESGKIDPDYASYNSALELNEEEDKKENLLKLKRIIEEEYNREIMQRQEHIEQIELQICKVRKLLHLLRYALIMSYYKKKELEYSGNEDEASTSDSLIVPDKQSRIHPAIKKLLGKNVDNLDQIHMQNKRKSNARISKGHDSPPIGIPEVKKPKFEETKLHPVPDVKIVTSENCMRQRKKNRHRIIVGNISKWMPSSEDDLLTHKWMVYVRGPKDKPDVSHIIEKIVFYLHPSYKPHDVVEVIETPFHLSRRGWGEFPVRVQIFFKIPLNKPIDVIHNIKLDKTYTGRQTLGNETLVDVFLYDDNNEEVVKEEQMIDEGSSLNIILQEHNYCLPPDSVHISKIKQKIEQDETNSLIYGLENYIQGGYSVKSNKLMLVARRVETKRTLHQSETNTFTKICLPTNRFKNIGEALPYLFKRLPLFTDLANNLFYKRYYPFTASSLKEFVSWNVGKRRSSEWSRARLIKKLLMMANIYGAKNCNTKMILMYGRSHDFTPFISYGLFARDSPEKHLLLSCFTNSGTLSNFSLKLKCLNNEDVTVNVDSDFDDENERKLRKFQSVIDISDANTRLECSFIKQTALDCGVVLKNEEIDEGIVFNGAEIMILEAVKSLAENLIRRAKNHRVCTKISSPNTSAINREDVEIAINERQEIAAMRQFRLERRNIEYFS